MMRCRACQSRLAISRLECAECGLTLEGRFATPRLVRLAPDDQQLIESFVLCGGSLKTLAEDLSVSYPTVRKRLDGLIERLESLRSADERQAEAWLEAVERGSMKPEMAARLMQELAHG